MIGLKQPKRGVNADLWECGLRGAMAFCFLLLYAQSRELSTVQLSEISFGLGCLNEGLP